MFGIKIDGYIATFVGFAAAILLFPIIQNLLATYITNAIMNWIVSAAALFIVGIIIIPTAIIKEMYKTG